MSMIPKAILDDYFTLLDDSCVAVLPHVLRITAELGIAEVLGDSALSLGRTAELVGTDPFALRRLMRALESLGLVSRQGELYMLTGHGLRLRPDASDSVHTSVINAESQRAWLEGLEAIRTGKPVFDAARGVAFFDHKNGDDESNAAFLRRMRERASRLYPEFASVVDWTESRVVLDIGGGDGYQLEQVLGRFDHLEGVLFDRPSVIDHVRSRSVLGRLESRIGLTPGDFFESIPEGADTHILCSVLHNWSDEDALTILRNSRKSLRPDGRLLIVEMLVPSGDEWHVSKWSDLGMMVLIGGAERTLGEYENLLSAAGFTIRATTPMEGSAFVVIESS